MRNIVFTLFILGFTVVSYGYSDQDSLSDVWKDNLKPAELRLQTMAYVCDNILLRSDLDSASYVASEMLALAVSSDNSKYKAEALRIQGESFHFRGNIPEAQRYFEESLSISKEEHYPDGIATAYSSLGNILAEQGNYEQAIEYYYNSLEISENVGDLDDMANTLIAIGIIHYDQGDPPGSLALFEKALVLTKEADNARNMGRISNNIGVIYHEQGSFDLAQQYFTAAFELFEEIGEKRGMAGCLNNIGDLHTSQGKFKEALPYNMRSLEIRTELGDKRGMANCYNVIGDNWSAQGDYVKALEYYLLSAEIRDELDEKRALSRVYGNIGELYLALNDFAKSRQWCDKSYRLSKSIGAPIEEKTACECLFRTYKSLGQLDLALEYHELLLEYEHELNSEETVKALQALEFKKLVVEDSLRKEQEKILIELKHREEVSRTSKQRNLLLLAGLGVLVLSGGLFTRLRHIRKSNVLIQKEKDRSDELLLNILPVETANELKETGSVAAKHFDHVTVMFTDFQGFTSIADRMTPQELVSEIDYCYKAFDEIISRYNIEKIKTIGDAYMCCGGLPIANKTNPGDVVKAALEIQSFMHGLKLKREAAGQEYFELRIGINSGPVVAGIVGTKKFQYDVWGMTVNIASRMESHSEVGQVNISKETYELIRDDFNCTHRGKIEAKNVGAINMYFVQPMMSPASVQ